jgi:hypothetical protein
LAFSNSVYSALISLALLPEMLAVSPMTMPKASTWLGRMRSTGSV